MKGKKTVKKKLWHRERGSIAPLGSREREREEQREREGEGA
jgi:hypothetical protein